MSCMNLTHPQWWERLHAGQAQLYIEQSEAGALAACHEGGWGTTIDQWNGVVQKI